MGAGTSRLVRKRTTSWRAREVACGRGMTCMMAQEVVDERLEVIPALVQGGGMVLSDSKNGEYLARRERGAAIGTSSDPTK